MMKKKAEPEKTEGVNKIKSRFQLTEKQRTIILISLLIFAIGFIYWTKNSYNQNFIDSF